jgi:hypothetical protein
MKPNFYAIIPASVRYDTDLSSSEKLFYAEITAMSNERGYCWATNSYFAELFDVSKNTITRWVASLKSKNHVKVSLNFEDKKMTYRKIYPLNKNVDTPLQKCSGGTHKNVDTPLYKNVDHNSTSINTTSNNKSRAKRFSPPSLDEVKQYCEERNNEIDPEYFIDFYTSKNWMIGKNKMKDWKAAVRTWEKKEKSFAKKEKEPNQISDYDQKEKNLLAQLKKSLIQVYGDFTDTNEQKRIVNEIRTELLKIKPNTVKDYYKRIAKYCEQKRGTDRQYLKNLKSLIHGS